MKELDTRLTELAKDGKVSCHQLRALAEELEVSYKDAGDAANRNKIKIAACELGCF